jgi:hypothetical protein
VYFIQHCQGKFGKKCLVPTVRYIKSCHLYTKFAYLLLSYDFVPLLSAGNVHEPLIMRLVVIIINIFEITEKKLT